MHSLRRSPSRRVLGPGSHIGDHLVIQSVLGRGGTAVVFEALHTRLRSAVAVKVVDAEGAFVDDASARIQREAQVCAAIEDVHVPKVFDVGELEDGARYIVMEKVSGPTLESMLEAGPLAPELATSIARDLLSALEAVHRADVVHRDIKPSNVIVQRGEAHGACLVRLMDFGVSRAPTLHAPAPAITREGTIIGTPYYMAPEQITDEGIDARADLYAVGVLLYEMLSGRVPCDGQTTAEVMSAVLRHEHVPLSRAWPEAPASIAAFVTRAIAHAPDARFSSAREMRDALDAALSSADAAMRKRAAMQRWLRYGAALTVPIALGGLLAMATRLAPLPRSPRQESPSQAPALRMAEPASTPRVELPTLATEPKPAAAMPTVADAAPRSANASEPRTPSKREEPTTSAEPTHASAAPLPPQAGVLVSEYVAQLNELQRALSAPLAPHPPEPLDAIPANPYDDGP